MSDNITQDQLTADKKKSNKKIYAVIGVIIILILIIAGIVAYNVASKKITASVKEVENFVNSYIENNRQSISLTEFSPFTCAKNGLSIICKSSQLELADSETLIAGKDLEFVINPGITSASIDTRGNITIEISSILLQTSPITFDIDCNHDLAIKDSQNYLINDIQCSTKLGNITSKQDSTFYLKHEVFGKGNFYKVINSLKENKALMEDFTSNFEYAMINADNTISSKTLAKDMLDLYRKVDISNEQATDDELKESFKATKEQFNIISEQLSDENSPLKPVSDMLNAIDNVLNKNHNKLIFQLSKRDDADIEDLFFVGTEPKYYDITITSK